MITPFLSYQSGVLSFEIRGVDYAYDDTMYVTYIRHNTVSFPAQLLAIIFDEAFVNVVMPFMTSDSFLVYNRRFVHKNTGKIGIKNSTGDEYGTYSSGSFTATDPTSGAKVDGEFNSISKAVTFDVTRP